MLDGSSKKSVSRKRYAKSRPDGIENWFGGDDFQTAEPRLAPKPLCDNREADKWGNWETSCNNSLAEIAWISIEAVLSWRTI